MRIKYYLIAILASIAIASFMFFRKTDSAMDRFAAKPASTPIHYADNNSSALSAQPAHFCPAAESLVKKQDTWTTADHKWENYTPSSATKILNFLGAQWVGVKIGKIICLYQTNEAVAFPVALEQTRSQLILEPTSLAWSVLVGNRRFCKSANVADCSYFIEPPKNSTNIYKEIEYAPLNNDTRG